MFLYELQGLPPKREIYFTIKVQLEVDLILIPLYQMAVIELKELEIQLTDMLEKGFILPSVSPLGSSCPFYKAKG